MDAEIKARWLAALRDGEYREARDTLIQHADWTAPKPRDL